jgi:hypothetical protein
MVGGWRPVRAYGEVRAHPALSKLLAATPTALHPRSRRPSTLNLQCPPSSRHVAGACRLLRAYCEMRPHPARGESHYAASAAEHSPLRWVSRVPPSPVLRGRGLLAGSGIWCRWQSKKGPKWRRGGPYEFTYLSLLIGRVRRRLESFIYVSSQPNRSSWHDCPLLIRQWRRRFGTRFCLQKRASDEMADNSANRPTAQLAWGESITTLKTTNPSDDPLCSTTGVLGLGTDSRASQQRCRLSKNVESCRNVFQLSNPVELCRKTS